MAAEWEVFLLLKIHVKEEGGKIEKYLDTGEQLPLGAKRVWEEKRILLGWSSNHVLILFRHSFSFDHSIGI